MKRKGFILCLAVQKYLSVQFMSSKSPQFRCWSPEMLRLLIGICVYPTNGFDSDKETNFRLQLPLPGFQSTFRCLVERQDKKLAGSFILLLILLTNTSPSQAYSFVYTSFGLFRK